MLDPSILWMGTRWLFGGILGGALAGWVLAATTGFTYSQRLVMTAFGVVGVLISALIGSQILTARLRPYLRRVLEERKDEIAQIK